MALLQQTKHVLGSTAILTVNTGTAQSAERLLIRLWQMLDDFEDRFSRFKLTSELSQANLMAGSLTPISAGFKAILTAAQAMSVQTDGLYNPFVLPALQRAGYVGSWPDVHESDTKLDFRDRRFHTIDAMRLTNTTLQIPATAAIDLGGIGKGYILDLLADQASQETDSFWFSLGGDIICQGYTPDDEPWQLQVQASQNDGNAVAMVKNTAGERLSLATSGTTKRGGQTWHHLLDPRTGQPAGTDVVTASVIAQTATAADVYASCLILLGQKGSKAFLENHGAAGLLQTNRATNHSQSVQIHGKGFTLITITGVLS